jgi:hypothetical protein
MLKNLMDEGAQVHVPRGWLFHFVESIDLELLRTVDEGAN